MGSRRQSRELALQMLYQWDVGKNSPEHVLSHFFVGKKVDSDEEAFARLLFEGTVNNIEALDRKVRECSEHWRLERMAAVDRNIIRLALCELLHYARTPAPVVINEAVELARRFSGEEAVEFVNGVLDGVWKKEAAAKSPL
jgi:N utilization substance protein B